MSSSAERTSTVAGEPADSSGKAGDVRRRNLVRVALEVIAERGFADTRIADVADRAGVSPALVIYYFQTKERLLTEALRSAEDSWYELGAARAEAQATAAGRLEEIVAMTCLPQEDEELPESWALWLDMWTQSVRRPEIAAVREEFDNHWRRTITEIVQAGQESGEFIDRNAEDFAITFSALLDGLAVQIALNDPVVDSQRAFEVAMTVASESLGFPWSAP